MGKGWAIEGWCWGGAGGDATPTQGWGPRAVVEGAAATPRRDGRRLPGRRRHHLSEPLPRELAVAGGGADRAAQRTGVSPTTSPQHCCHPGLARGHHHPASHPGDPSPLIHLPPNPHLPSLGTRCDPLSRLGPRMPPSCCFGTNYDPLIQLSGHLHPPGPARWLFTPLWPSVGLAVTPPLGGLHPLQHLHENTACVPEGLHHHLGGPGRQPLQEKGYVGGFQRTQGVSQTLGVVSGT